MCYAVKATLSIQSNAVVLVLIPLSLPCVYQQWSDRAGKAVKYIQVIPSLWYRVKYKLHMPKCHTKISQLYPLSGSGIKIIEFLQTPYRSIQELIKYADFKGVAGNDLPVRSVYYMHLWHLMFLISSHVILHLKGKFMYYLRRFLTMLTFIAI